MGEPAPTDPLTEGLAAASRPTVGLAGSGRLHAAIGVRFGALAVPVAAGAIQLPEQVGMLVVAADGWDTRDYPRLRQLAWRAGVPWLPVRTELSHAVVGPLERPGSAGCVECAQRRHDRNRDDIAELAEIRARYGEQLAQQPSAWLTGLAVQVIATMVNADADRLTGAAGPHTDRALLRLSLADLVLTRHPFLPDPLCPVCGGIPDDAPEHVRLVLGPQRAYAQGSFRARDLASEEDRLTSTYVDPYCGLLTSVQTWDEGGIAVAAAPLTMRGGHAAAGYGRSTSLRTSRLAAMLEALERYGSAPGGRRTAITASFSELGDSALDPRGAGSHTPEQHQLPGFPFRPFDVDQPYRWVWGWSLCHDEPILVPEHLAYYGLPHEHSNATAVPFVSEISNGCALGGSLVEAILYGLLEVAERDAFLLTWYARLSAPRLDVNTARLRRVPLLAAAVAAENGYQVHTFDITMEQGIPCVWALAVNNGADHRPALASAAGAHPMPELAVHNALSELAVTIGALTSRYQDPVEAERARRMAADPDLVTRMEDHALRYADPGAREALAFLDTAGPGRPIGDLGAAASGGLGSDDLNENLREAVARYRAHGLNVIVVDQTTDEHRAARLSCVKVLVPGTLPMTFGHRFRRLAGLPRLQQVPQLLGYRDDPLPLAEVNPYPHPFP